MYFECVSVCVCVCEREKEIERDRQRERERERGGGGRREPMAILLPCGVARSPTVWLCQH